MRETRVLDRLLKPTLGAAAGQRDVLRLPWAAALATRVRRRLTDARLLPADALAVQCTLFDKTPARNWLVAWHQDLSVPVQGHTADSAWRGWSDKQGVGFVQAPAAWLERLLAVRLHIDPCGADAGPLRVVPASHRHGRLALKPGDSGARMHALRQSLGEVTCTAQAGDALLMRPLIAHASSRMAKGGPARRRVLHLVFAPPGLPDGLQWHNAV